MRFEEVLPLMREGKKATLPSLKKESRYFTCIFECLMGMEDSKWLTLIQVKKKFNFGIDLIAREDKLTIINDISPPGIYIAYLMSDEWEIVDEI